LPASTEPVSETLRIAGCAARARPSASPPETMVSTPAGITSCSSAPRRSVAIGVKGDGFNTMLLPASSAGAIFQTAEMTG